MGSSNLLGVFGMLLLPAGSAKLEESPAFRNGGGDTGGGGGCGGVTDFGAFPSNVLGEFDAPVRNGGGCGGVRDFCAFPSNVLGDVGAPDCRWT